MTAQLEAYSKLISKQVNLDFKKVKNTIELLNDGATIPFISRYRKERTGSLDEVQVEKISDELSAIIDLVKRKEYILKIISDQGLLNDKLKTTIDNCWSTIELEDLYLPFKKKTKTKATIAKEKGLEALAVIIIRQQEKGLKVAAQRFVNAKVANVEEALEGARYIIAEWVNENKKARDIVRRSFEDRALIVAKVVKKKQAEAEKYTDYFSFAEKLNKIPSHRLLAIFRGENEGYLKVGIEVDEANALYHLENFYTNTFGECAEQIKLALKDAYKRLVFPSIENEYRKAAKEKADDEAIAVFAENLRQLLLAAPLGNKNILAIDPGFRSGCKLVVLGKNGDFNYNSVIYPHPPQMQIEETRDTVTSLVKKYKIEAIAIGNGTAGKETLSLLKSFDFESAPELYLVNESGASIYSASAIAREEFPDHDLTVRGAISIGRRLMDPLAELVKIDAKSIGVGQYQHDVNQPKLKKRLDQVVESCVNSIGINLNTASKHLLAYVSGVGPGMAQNIVDYRTEINGFKSRKELLKVPRMGKKAFEQAAGFLRIKDGKDPLDDTAVHPECYSVVKSIFKDNGYGVSDVFKGHLLLDQINLSAYVNERFGMPTLKDIISELKKPGVDPRGKAKTFSFAPGINTMEDIRVGMTVPGIVNNLTKFGAFVDIGIKESGLLHISQITDRFIKDPSEVLKLNQELNVRITDIDVSRKRISLSLK